MLICHTFQKEEEVHDVRCYVELYGNTCLLLNNATMNSVGTFNEECGYE